MKSKSRQLRLRLSAFSLTLVASLALAGLVSASASAVSISSPGNFTESGGGLEFAVAPNVAMTCQKSVGTGNLSGSTGTLQMSFEGCKAAGAYTCTTAGQPAGTIRSKPLTINLEYIAYLSPRFGLGIKPAAENIFAEYECAYILGNRTLRGGVIAEVTSPALSTPFTQATLKINKISQTEQEHSWLQASQKFFESGGKEGYWYTYRLSEERKGFGTIGTALQSNPATLNIASSKQFLP